MALETAKANVVQHYAVVGVLEMWDETLEVMENTLPFFFSGKIRLQSAYYTLWFSGAQEMYKKQLQHHGLDNQNLQKHKVSEEVKNIVRKNFSREIEFYEFCKKRLKVQLHKIS